MELRIDEKEIAGWGLNIEGRESNIDLTSCNNWIKKAKMRDKRRKAEKNNVN